MPRQEYIYTFILGRNTALSVAEIFSVLTRERFVFVILSISANALIIKTTKEIKNAQWFLDCLGGTIKIAEILEKTNGEKDIKEIILNFIINNKQKTKFVWGISSYDLDNMGVNRLNRFGFEIKNSLKKEKVSSRFIQLKNVSFLSAPEIINNKVLGKGKEIILIKTENGVLIGETIAIQNFQSYSFRDYERPKRNPKSGMLPPKLAQIMINFAPSCNCIYDPFCGNGTILAEAMLMGRKVLGSDLLPRAVSDTKENIYWLKDKYNFETTINPEKDIFQSDATNITERHLPYKPECIVSEIYLGPPLARPPHKEELYKTTSKIEKMLLSFLKNTFDNLAYVEHLILAIPFYKIKGADYKLNIIDQIEYIGYNILSPFESIKINQKIIPEHNHTRKTVLYSREGQIVGREIIILRRR